MERNVVGWFEIYVDDMDRAINFYKDLLGYPLEKKDFGEGVMATFPFDIEKDLPACPGALCKGMGRSPSSNGSLVYFTSPTGNCANELAKVESVGGKIILEKTLIPEGHGNMVIVEDSEGNHIAIHSME